MRHSVRLLILTAMPLLGCFNATATVTGEEPLLVDNCQPGGTNAGNRWQDLYACYFGPSGQASCGSRNGCHGGCDQLGTIATGFVCGPSADACWGGMTGREKCPTLASATLVPPGGSVDGGTVHAKQTILYATIRKAGSGTMPKNSTYTFQPEDLARITDWIEKGAQNN